MVTKVTSQPDLSLERAQFDLGATVVGAVDEVGRGSLAGPVSIGLVLLNAATANVMPPAGIKDSKQLSAIARAGLAPQIKLWALAAVVAHASAAEIDKLGIIGALRLATHRALAAVKRQCTVDVLLLDGTHDWLTGPATMPRVVMQVKGDQTSIGIAAASIIAKHERDQLMAQLAPQHPEYEWANNKGYASSGHMSALVQYGPTKLHRRSWNLNFMEKEKV